jgi:TrmH RNA methyltransferase
MSDDDNKNPLYRGPGTRSDQVRGPRPPRRDVERSAPRPSGVERHESAGARPSRDPKRYSPRADFAEAGSEQHPAKIKEFRLHGLNACLAAFKKRPESIRKLWLLEARIPKLTELLAFCVKNRIGYNVVENEDLEKLTASAHHEGVCMAVLPQPELNLSTWLMAAPQGPCLLIWLDGVGNPHNLGAIMRSAAHFGVKAILLPKDSGLANSGAAARVAEGAAEHVPLIRLGRTENAVAQLNSAGFTVVSAVVRGGQDIFSSQLPARCVLVVGAEQTGVDPALVQISNLKVAVPGSGLVESLNVSAATAVMLAEWWRQTR